MLTRVAILSVAALLLPSSNLWAEVTKQTFKPGWDNRSEPLNYAMSNVKWSLSSGRRLTITYTLVGARPSNLYQVGLHFFCEAFASTFGQYPVAWSDGGQCTAQTREGTTHRVAITELGVVTTDRFGKGTLKVVVGPIPSGSYALEFTVRNAAGCLLTGGATDRYVCTVDFQSPGHHGNTTSILVP